MNYSAEIGIFGGTGFYSLLDNVTEVDFDTPYGKTSEKIAIGTYDNKKIAFIPRHGKNHEYAPHNIPYRANLYAMKALGVKRILAPTASGSLQPNIAPGDFVICDQFVDRTFGRKDTFFEGKEGIVTDVINGQKVEHFSAANVYCDELRNIAIKSGNDLGIKIHNKGTVVVINGPRFSTVSESRWYSKMGWEVINMTQYPESFLAKELGICYCNISLITDYDVGLEENSDIKPVTDAEVRRVFEENNEKVKNMLYNIIKMIPSSPCTYCTK